MWSLMDVMAVICLLDHWYHVFSILAEGLSNLMAASLLEELAIGISLYKDEINGSYMNVYDLLVPQ
ncbi:hypothetical protein SLEP1_g36603 [Rubroshorea leprosula]|uniref:Uncharacterized protein n=1 Tax=Rubroshorea leprosula TaxID=152421 RepID=A0AAV5KSI8_9ROSI|nr:hypothetical protein SLEP1_g36603 [Rubroshorea leprosula]